MVENADLDLAVAVALADSHETVSDEDFKSPGLNQQRLLAAHCNFGPKLQLQKKKKQKKRPAKEGLTESAPEGKTSRARGRDPKRGSATARKDSNEETSLRSHNAIANEHAKRTASFFVAELDNFRFRRGPAGALPLDGAALLSMHAEAPAESIGMMEEGGSPRLRAQGFPLCDSADDHGGDCLVIDIETEEVVELSNESQFSVLLRLCGEEGLDTGSSHAVISAAEMPTGSSVGREGPQAGDDIARGVIPVSILEATSRSSSSRILHSRKDSDPVINDVHALNIQACDNPERENSQSESCQDDGDDISSVMTQKCPSLANRGEASPNPSARFDVDMQGIHPNIHDPAEPETAEDVNDNLSGDRAGLQARELGAFSEQNCEAAGRITADAPCGSTRGEGMRNGESLCCDRFAAADVDLGPDEVETPMKCPVCGENISSMSVEDRVTHTNACLDRVDHEQVVGVENDLPHVPGSDRVKKWLEQLSLSKYAALFVQQEIDWETLPWLTEEDFLTMGITAVGPRRKILRALEDLKTKRVGRSTEQAAVANDECQIPAADSSGRIQQGNGRDDSNVITNYFPPPNSGSRHIYPLKNSVPSNGASKFGVYKNKAIKRPRNAAYHTLSGVPSWMCIPGTPFRVDAFQHLSGDCSHWFLTHFHTDHYQGLTRGFRHGHIFCSLITARLVNLRIGVSWDKLMIIPLNDKFKVAGVDVTFIDANHCPGSVMILFEPPNGEAVLHTGDFRFCKEMVDNPLLQTVKIHTLVLDTTYCDPQYDFPSQKSVVQFVVEAIQAEAFNPETLFLIGAYTIGKERIFLEVAKVLKKYVYVGVARKRLLDCMDLAAEDTKWLTCNALESFIHVVPLWSISSFKRMSSLSRHYQDRFKLIVAFYPSGWSFGRGKKRTPGKRWQQGTMIRYEVPYSEHCSFPELKEFLKFTGPDDIIPSVLDKSGKGTDEMIATLWSEAG